jgi:cellulose synthase/poly-beta-1,6-N-acetylglucosamine synthase-like glycosyltransferase
MSDFILSASSGLMMIYGMMILFLTRKLNPEPENSAAGKLPDVGSTALPFVSIIISIRNEAKNLRALITSLRNQNYAGGYEIIITDDHSTDEPARIISEYSFQNLRYLAPEPEAVGKKRNLNRALMVAKSEIILTTDADCIHSPEWIGSMTEKFSDPKAQLVTGPVNIIRNDFFSGLQAMEFLSLMASTRIATELKKPIMANGANMAYRKTAFQLANGYDENFHISSGDDQFLLGKIKNKFPEGIRFAKNHYAVVLTIPASGLREFFHQRLRWAAKWRHDPNPISGLTAVFVLLIQTGAIFLMFSPLVNQNPWFLFLLFKIIPDYFLLSKTAKLQNLTWNNLDFLIVSICYPFYVVLTGVLSFFITPEWKSRPVHT